MTKARSKVVTDESVSEPLEAVKGRIRGIDELSVATAWRFVECQLPRTPEGGRDEVIDELQERIEYLEQHGERDLPGLSPEEQHERALEAYEAVAPKADAVFLDENGEPQTSVSASQKLAAITDGGEEK